MGLLEIRPADQCRWDLVALGEVMLRLDPGEGRIATSRSFEVWEGGGEYNVARGLRRCFGLRTRRGHRPGRQPRGPPGRGPRPARRRGPVPRALGALRRRRARGAQRPQLHRARLRRARRRGLLGPRPHGGLPAAARRHRLGRGVRRRGRALVPQRRHLRGARRTHRRRGHRGHGGGPPARHGRLLRPQLPALAVARGRRPGARPRGQPAGRAARRRHVRQRRGLQRGAGLRGRRGSTATSRPSTRSATAR